MSIETPRDEPLALVTNGDPPDETRPLTDDDRKLVMEAMRHLAGEQLERAERVRLSARQTFVYVSGLFTIAQVVAFTGFAQDSVSEREQRWIVIAGIAAAASLVITGVLALLSDRLRTAADIAPKDILEEADKAEEGDEPVSTRLTKLYLDTVNSRSKAIGKRRRWMGATTFFAIATVVLALGEIVVSLVSRLP